MSVRNAAHIDIPDFTGGLNTKDGAGGVADNQYVEGNNVYLVNHGIAKRKGFARYTGAFRINSTASGMGIFEAPFVDNGTQVIGVAGTKIKLRTSAAWTDKTGSVDLTTDKQALFVMINNNLVGVNGTDPAWYYSGSGNAITLAGKNIPTAPTCAEAFHGRLFLSSGRELRWGDYMQNWNNPFPDNNDQLFDDTITGLKILGDRNNSFMLVFTNTSIHACDFDPSVGSTVGGDGAFRFTPISYSHGCVSRHSTRECTLENGQIVIIFADSDGLKLIDSSLNITKLTENIQPTWTALNASRLKEAIGFYYKPKRWYGLICSSAGSTTHDTVIIFDLQFRVVVGIFDWVMSTAGLVTIDGVASLVGSNYSGFWNQYDTGQNDNTAVINGYFRTKAYDGGLPLNNKGFRSLAVHHAYFGVWDIDILAMFDQSLSSYSTSVTSTTSAAKLGDFILDQDRLGSVDQLVVASAELAGHGRLVQYEISNKNADEPFRIHRLIGTHRVKKEILYR